MKKAQRIARSRKGGYTRVARFSVEQRHEIALIAARTRWAKQAIVSPAAIVALEAGVAA